MYDARITRQTPTLFIVMIDQSGSMAQAMNYGPAVVSKAEAVADITDRLLREMVNQCRREDGVMDYFDIGVIGYGGDGVCSLFGAKELVKPSKLAMSPGTRRTVTRERVLPDGRVVVASDEIKRLIEPRAGGNTPMAAAFEKVLGMVRGWCARGANAQSYPPTVFNITDGEPSDGSDERLTSLAEKIKAQGTVDGNTLLLNINLASVDDPCSVIFPASEAELPQARYCKLLYDMSSTMPAAYDEAVVELRGGGAPFRGMAFNASVAQFIDMLTIGSRSTRKMY